MSLTVPARELEDAFHTFLHGRGIILNSVAAPTLFLALVDYFNEVRMQGCSVEEGWDYLHFEAGGNSFYFERILYTSDTDENPDNDERVKCGMTAGPELEVFSNGLEFPSTNLWSQNYPSAATFAEAVLKHPALRWAETAGSLKSSTFFEEMC